MVLALNDQNYELKHIVSILWYQFSKIAKELSFDHLDTDRSIREEIQRC